jgi:hypothetical protein
MTFSPKVVETIGTVGLIVSMLVARQIVLDTTGETDRMPLLLNGASSPDLPKDRLGARAPAADSAATSLQREPNAVLWIFLVNSTDQFRAVQQFTDDWNSWRESAGLPEARSVTLFSDNWEQDYRQLDPYRLLYEDAGVNLQVVDLRFPEARHGSSLPIPS